MIYLGYILIIIAVYFLVWLSRREAYSSLRQIQNSEKLLTNERKTFETIIQKRTDELLESERMRNLELERNAKFGELSKGLFHDLMNPLTSLSLYIENLNTNTGNITQSKDMLSKAITASRRMESFMNSIRHTSTNICDTNTNESDLTDELKIVYDLLAYKARMSDVEIKIVKFDKTIIKINSFRLHQLLLNLISNALDACIEKKEQDQNKIESSNKSYGVTIKVKNDADKTIITIEDNGSGISDTKLKDIFNIPFTTKPSGTGIGLITAKKIVDEELYGNIKIESRENVGTVGTIAIPNEMVIERTKNNRPEHAN